MYMRYIRETELSHTDASKYVYNNLHGEAIRLRNILPTSLSMKQVVDEIESHINSKTRQRDVRSDLDQLRLVKVRREKNIVILGA